MTVQFVLKQLQDVIYIHSRVDTHFMSIVLHLGFQLVQQHVPNVELKLIKGTHQFLSMLVDIQTIDGVYLGKVICEYENTYKLRYLVAKDKQLYDYDEEEDEIDKDCICGFYDVDDTEEDAGFIRVEGGFIKKDSDEDYEPSDCDDDTSSDESLVDSGEEDSDSTDEDE